jgi:hypothetical protein
MEQKSMFLAALIAILAMCLLISCTSENPLTPVIKDAWGDYDYFPFAVGTAWLYDAHYPQDSLTIEWLEHVDLMGHLDPYTAYRMRIVVDGVFLGYVIWAEPDEEVLSYDPYEDEWLLEYVVPFVLGNKWEEHTLVSTDPVTYLVHTERKVTGREHITVPAGTFVDCIKLREKITWTATDLQYADSSFYYVKDCWCAPNIGILKWVVRESDIPAMVGNSLVLKEFFRSYQGSHGFGYDGEGWQILSESAKQLLLFGGI